MRGRTEKEFWVEMSIMEVETQARFAEFAYRNIDPKASAGNEAVFSSIHSFLSHCANISKMLKASDGEASPTSIGDVLGIPISSIVHNREFRNHLEHYDERLKEWIRSKDSKGGIGSYNIGPKAAILAPGMIFISHYDPTNHCFTLVDEDCDLGALFAEVVRIRRLADGWISTRVI